MAHLVVLPIDDGNSIVVEVGSTDHGRLTRGGSADNLVQRAATSFEESFAQIKPAVAQIISQLRNAVQDTESVVVKFGIKCNAEAGAFIAKAAGEANFEVTINWKRQNAAAETNS
jgi:Trypsin-co-occurring domain 1